MPASRPVTPQDQRVTMEDELSDSRAEEVGFDQEGASSAASSVCDSTCCRCVADRFTAGSACLAWARVDASNSQGASNTGSVEQIA
eukprot:323270-Lingulodinium_polyedra.AAC.1